MPEPITISIAVASLISLIVGTAGFGAGYWANSGKPQPQPAQTPIIITNKLDDHSEKHIISIAGTYSILAILLIFCVALAYRFWADRIRRRASLKVPKVQETIEMNAV